MTHQQPNCDCRCHLDRPCRDCECVIHEPKYPMNYSTNGIITSDHRSWFDDPKFWREEKTNGEVDIPYPDYHAMLEEQDRRTKSELSDAEKVVILLAKVGDMNNDDHRSMATFALRNLEQQRHADYIASLLERIKHLEEELEDAHAAYGRANAKAMGLV